MKNNLRFTTAHRYYQLFLIICSMCILFCLTTSFLCSKGKVKDMRVDTVVFSFDRPLQLYAYLESAEKYLSNVNETHVIYRASNNAYDNGYQIVAQRFPRVLFHKQSTNPQNDFKSLVWASVYSNTSICQYVMFAVDDIIIKDSVDMQECTRALEDYKAWGFYLRLGKNINYCYMLNRPTAPPKGKDMGNLFCWKFCDGDGDWAYPNNVDNTIYRKKDILSYLKKEPFTNPNYLEGHWQKWRDMKGKGICFQTSKNINIPLNLVNPSYNRNNHLFTPAELLQKFQQGLKIDILKFHQVNNNAPHVDYQPAFIMR